MPILLLFFLQNIDCGYPLEPPRRARRFKRVPTIYVLEKKKKMSKLFYCNFHFFLQLVCILHKNLNILKEVLQGESILLINWFTENLMKANPDKFQAICMGQKTHDAFTSFQLNDTVITCEDNVTLLGVNIEFMLNFNDHISDICKKASQQLAVLKRIGRFLTKHGKLTIFKSFIMSNFNYCPLAWHFVAKLVPTRWKRFKKGL